MSKNLTRKGLALGAAFALVASAVVSTPAYAADGVVLTANTGTILAAPVTETLTLNASLVPSLPAGNIAQLKYKVVTDGSFIAKAIATSDATDTNHFTNTTSTTGVTGGGTNGIADESDNTNKYVVANVLTSTVITPTTPTVAAVNTLALSIDSVKGATGTAVGVAPTDVTATKTATVTAWIDSDLDGVVDAGEAQQTVTVSFLKYSEITATVDLTQPIQGDSTATATASLTNVNSVQFASDVKVKFNSATAVAEVDGVFTSGSLGTLAASQSVSAQVQFKTVNVGTAASKNATASTIASITGAIVVGANAISSGNTVRLNSAFTVKAVAKDGASPAVAVAGVALTAAVTTGATLSATVGAVKSITVAGVTYTDDTKLPTALALTTDANGEVFVAISSVGLAANDTIVVQFAGQNLTVEPVSTVQKAAVLTVTNDGGAVDKTTKGGSVTLGYTVSDQFGQAPTSALRLAVSAGGDSFVVATQYPAVVNGSASVTVTAAPATDDGDLTVSSALQSQGTDSNWGAVTTATNAADVVVTVTDTADAFDTVPTAAATGTIARVDTNGDLTNEVTLTGSLNNDGAKVLVSAAGLKFGWNGAVYTDSVLIEATGTQGNFSVDVYSHKPGTDVVVTFSAGTETKTSKVTWAAAAADEGTKLTLSVANAAAGQTMVVTGLLVDEYDNPVDSNQTTVTDTTVGTHISAVSVAYTGPGLVVGDLPTETDADGKFTFRVLLGSNDVVVGSVTATYGGDNGSIEAASATTSDDITVTRSLAAAVTQKVNAGSFKGYVAVYARGYEGDRLSAKIGKDWIIVPVIVNNQENGTLFRMTDFTGAGVDIAVRIYINRVLVDTINLTTK